MKRILAATLLFCFIFAGCTSYPPISLHKSEHGVEIRGSVTAEQAKELDLILSVLPRSVIRSVASLSSREDSSHFSNVEIGHCHWNRHICIVNWLFTNASTIWHEIGHAYTFYLNYKGPRFRDRWQEIPGGVITAYGATNYLEDVAEWVSEIYCLLTGRFSAVTLLKSSGEFFKDSYLKKLELLRDYGFISSENYEKILSPYARSGVAR